MSAILGALMVLLVAGLVDNLLLTAIQASASVTGFALGQLLGYGVIAGGVLLLGVLARSISSLVVSVFYVVLGGFFALLFVAYAVVIAGFAAAVRGRAPAPAPAFATTES